MRVAALYDIHGNLPALEAVLDDLRTARADRIVVGGDVLPGPMPRETLERLLALDTPTEFIVGNGDRAVLEEMRGASTLALPDSVRETIRWNAAQLGREHERVLASWPATLTLEVPPLGRVLFCHATPRNDTEIFTRLTPEERLAPLFAGVEARMIVCGHTHMQFDRRVGERRVVNAGSVGMPFGEPGAYWLLLDGDVRLHRTRYDLERAAERVRATEYPQAAEFAERDILRPPREEEILERFRPAELR